MLDRKYQGGYMIVDIGDEWHDILENGNKKIPGIYDLITKCNKPVKITGNALSNDAVTPSDFVNATMINFIGGDSGGVAFITTTIDIAEDTFGWSTFVLIYEDDTVSIGEH